MEKYKLMAQIFVQLEDELRKFHEKGNKAAGLRARKHLLEIKKLAREMRHDIQRLKVEPPSSTKN